MAGSEWDKMMSGDYYNAYDPELVAARYKAKKWCRRFNDTDGDPDDLGLEGLTKK